MEPWKLNPTQRDLVLTSAKLYKKEYQASLLHRLLTGAIEPVAYLLVLPVALALFPLRRLGFFSRFFLEIDQMQVQENLANESIARWRSEFETTGEITIFPSDLESLRFLLTEVLSEYGTRQSIQGSLPELVEMATTALTLGKSEATQLRVKIFCSQSSIELMLRNIEQKIQQSPLV